MKLQSFTVLACLLVLSGVISDTVDALKSDGSTEYKRKLMPGGQTVFSPLGCNSDLVTAPCSTTLSSLLSSTIEGGEVVIPCGTCATLDVTDGSQLEFPGGINIIGKLLAPHSASATLRTKHVYVQGELKIEPPNNDNVVTFLLFGTEDEYLIPHTDNMHSCDATTGCKVGKKAFVTAGGKLDIHALSDPTCPSWVNLLDVDSTSNPGDKDGPLDIIEVGTEAASCWKINDEILITSPDADMNAKSVATVQAIDKAAGIITLTSSPIDLYYESSAAADADFAVEVARLTRSVIVMAEEDDAVDAGDGLVGGHFIVLHTPDIYQHIEGVEFRDMGQQGNLGRYPIHFHMCNNAGGSMVKKNVIRDSNQRGVVIHGTNNVVVDNNIAFNVFGHGFLTEDGVERDITFSYNLGASFHAPTHQINHPVDGLESDNQVSTFWVTVTENNHWIGNVAAGSGRAGFWFDTRFSFRGRNEQPWNRDKSIGTFKDNTAHSNQWGFMWYSPGWAPVEYNVIENTKSFRNRFQGHFIHNNRNIHFKGGIIADNHAGATRTLDNVRNVTMSNFRIMGHTDTYAAIRRKRPGFNGVDCSPWIFPTMFFHSRDALFPELDAVGITLEDSTFTHGMICPTPAIEMEGAHIFPNAASNINKVKNVTFPDGWAGPRFSRCMVTQPDLALVVEVLDGAFSLTGSAGAYVSDDEGLKSQYTHCEPPEEGSCAVYCQNSPYVAPITGRPSSSPSLSPSSMPSQTTIDPTTVLINVAVGKSASQSATAHGGTADRAVDGNTDGYWSSSSIAHGGGAGWWMVDLGDNHDIHTIKIYNRLDCCKENLDSIKVLIFDKYSNIVLERTLLSNSPDVVTLVLDEHVNGKIVQIQSPVTLMLAEVEVFAQLTLTNLAMGKFATQSATAHGGTADRAIDGNADGYWSSGSVAHGGGAGWWMVDLGSMHDIFSIRIYNRLDCCKENLDSIEVLLLDTNSQVMKQTTLVSNSADVVTWELDIPTSAKIVKIQSPVTLMLAEVEVYGILSTSAVTDPDIVNLALGQPTSQKSSPFAPMGTSDRAVDGNTDGFWGNDSVTHGGGNDWWVVDLGEMHSIHNIKIYNRLDCCMERLDNINILIFDDKLEIVTSKIVTTSSAPVVVWELDSPVIGKEVQVQNSQILSMAEVEVMGKKADTRRLLRGKE